MSDPSQAHYEFIPAADSESEVGLRMLEWDGRPRAVLSVKRKYANGATRLTALGPDECDNLAAVLRTLAGAMRGPTVVTSLPAGKVPKDIVDRLERIERGMRSIGLLP